MEDRIHINTDVTVTKSFSDNLKEIGCQVENGTIRVYKKDGDKVFFKAGNCKLHLTTDEFNKVLSQNESDA